MPSKCQRRTLSIIRDLICVMDDNRLVDHECKLSVEVYALMRDWVHAGKEGKAIPISFLDESVRQVEIEIKLVHAEMLRRGLDRR
jgi:hypothetical protein